MKDSSFNASFLSKFQAVVERLPDNTAILVEGRLAVSYKQLLEQASTIARAIIDAKITPTELRDPDSNPIAAAAFPSLIVGIGISKSAEYIASMLGTWLAGAAFVPLDPRMPKERLQFIVEQAGINAILIRDGGEHIFSSTGARLLKVGGVADAVVAPYEVAVPESAPHRLAYIIYTSGSTGRPKGVMVPHRGIVNFIAEQIAAFKLTASSRALFFLSTNFDASVSDIGTALLSGAAILIEPEGLLKPGPHFTDLLNDRQVTHMDIPPSLLRVMDPSQMPKSLETVIIGGEACAPEVVRNWASHFRVVNVYGPTEATVCTSLGACDAATWERPLIGRPMANITYQILDADAKPVTQGTPGELYIGGISLALGYVDEPELTKNKFPTVNNERLYKTGDNVVACEDGEIQFLGRIDRQFKLRGMLIEPEEIEAKLEAHEGVARAAVLKRTLHPERGSEKLVAFVVPRAAAEIDEEQLKQHLAKALPRWMVPQIIELLPVMPMTVTGKSDLQKLRTQPLRFSPAASGSGEISPTQAVLADIWKRVLGLDAVNLNDDFFALGGDSLNVIEVIVAAHLKGLTISPDLFIEQPTILGLSEALSIESSGAPDPFSCGAMPSEALLDDVRSDEQVQTILSRSLSDQARLQPMNALKKVFVTGATGFLGARLLHELLSSTGAQFYCLVRARSEEEGLERLKTALALHDKYLSNEDCKRITICCGDLESNRLGLSDSLWTQVANEVDTIIHSAAVVNMLKNYRQLRRANVGGTLEIMRLLFEGSPKALHYASTLSVFVATDRNTGVVRESDKLEQSCLVYGGYAQTKYAAELLLRMISAQAAPVFFYRFGLLTGDSKTGLSAADDFLGMFARGIAALGCAPLAGSDIKVDITPVDYAAAIMRQLIVMNAAAATKQSTPAPGDTYHIANAAGLALPELIAAMQDVGLMVSTVQPHVFFDRLKTHSAGLSSSEAAACLALCRCLGDQKQFEQFRTMDLFQATDISFDAANCKRALGEDAVRCPPASRHLIARYLRHQFSDSEVLKPLCEG